MTDLGSRSTTSGPDLQEASAILSVVMARLVDNDIDAPFVPTAYFEHTNDPLTATRTRYAQRDMAGRLEAILRPLTLTHDVDDNDASPGASDTDDESWPPTMTPSTEASDSESLLSLSDDEEHTEAGFTA
jgi:hypothetical protein